MSTKTETKTKEKTRHIPMYKVLFHNDDSTTMHFVIFVLMAIFNKNQQDAEKIMWFVHETGVGLAGVYALEHAELKQEQTISMARTRGFPLHVSIEPDN